MAIFVRDLESDFSADTCDLSAEVVLDGLARRMAFHRFGNHPNLRERTDTFDPFAVALLLPAMIRGEPLVIEGTVDERLLLALEGPVQSTICLPLMGARCQLADAYRNMPYIHCQTMRNVAASMTLDHLFSHFHYASSEPFGACAARSRFAGIATLEPQLLPLFNTDHGSWHAFGGDTTRLRKTADVLADERLRSMLLVCMRGFRRGRPSASRSAAQS